MTRTTSRRSDAQLAADLVRRVLPEPSWAARHTLVAALNGLPLSPAQLTLFRDCTARQRSPSRPVTEAFILSGRRSGKTRAASAIAVASAVIRRYTLAPGEKGVVLLLGADRRQAAISKNYIAEMVRSVPALAAHVVNETRESIELLWITATSCSKSARPTTG